MAAAASLPSLIAHTTSEAPLTISPAAKTPSKLVCIDFKSIFIVPHLEIASSSALNNFGIFSGSKPKDLITKSAEILYSEPEGLNTKKELPKVEKSAFKKGVYY